MLAPLKKPRLGIRIFVYVYLFLAACGGRRVPLVKGLFYAGYSRMKDKYGVVQITTNEGIALSIDLRDNIIATFLIEYGEWEPGLTRVMQQLIRPGMRVIDIGAHIGYSTTLLSKLVGPEGSVTSFEPEPYNYSLLVKNAGGLTNCTLINCGVSDVEGVSVLYLAQGNLGAHSMHEKTGSSVEIKTIALDSAMREETIDFIKMDIEGNEPRALLGMEKLLHQEKLMLVFEYTPALVTNKEALFNSVRSYGFTPFVIMHQEGALVPFASIPSTPDGSNANILCVKNREVLKKLV